MPDTEVAARIKRNVVAVLKRRHRLQIPNRVPAGHVWTRKQIALLGTLPDTDVARRLGCPAYVATFKRWSLKIPRAQKPGTNANPWTPAEIKLLGTLPDEEVARRISRSVGAVIQRRELLHVPMQNPKLRDWTADEDGLLGTRSDAEIARRLGRTLNATSHRRIRLKIPAWRIKYRLPQSPRLRQS
jgi:hypothetical protein